MTSSTLTGSGPDTGYDVEAVRAQFPALAEGFAHFEGPGGTQVPASVAAAVAGSLRRAVSNVHSPVPVLAPRGRRRRRRPRRDRGPRSGPSPAASCSGRR